MLTAATPPRCSLLLTLALSLGCAHTTAVPPVAAAPPVSAPLPIPADLVAAVDRAEQVGRAIYLQDKASAIGTDVLASQTEDPRALNLGGYLTMPELDSVLRQPKAAWLVEFFTRGPDPKIAYQVEVLTTPVEKPIFQALVPPRPATAGERVLIESRQTAIAALGSYPQWINTVILPESAPERGTWVYLLAGTKRPGVAVLGRHVRVLVSPDGGHVARFEPLSKTIIEIPLRNAADVPVGAKVLELMVTSIVADAPLETHVFASLLYKMPISVVTARGTWLVNRGHVSFLGARSGQP